MCSSPVGWQGCQPYDTINLIAIQNYAPTNLLVEGMEDSLCPVDGLRLSGNGHTVAPADQPRPGSLFQTDKMTVVIAEDFLQTLIILKAQGCRAVSFLTGREGS